MGLWGWRIAVTGWKGGRRRDATCVGADAYRGGAGRLGDGDVDAAAVCRVVCGLRPGAAVSEVRTGCGDHENLQHAERCVTGDKELDERPERTLGLDERYRDLLRVRPRDIEASACVMCRVNPGEGETAYGEPPGTKYAPKTRRRSEAA